MKPQNIVKETWTDFWCAVAHPSSLLIVFFGLLVGFRSRWGVITVNVEAMASTIFQVAGTMVALILPASQFANSLVTRLVDELPKRIIKEKISAEEKKRITTELTRPLQANLYPAWRASALVFISFLFSTLAMLSPSWNFDFGVLTLSLDSLLVGLALSSLVIGSAWFLPTAQYAFNLKALVDMQEQISLIAEYQDAKNKAAPDLAVLQSPPAVDPTIVEAPPTQTETKVVKQ